MKNSFLFLLFLYVAGICSQDESENNPLNGDSLAQSIRDVKIAVENLTQDNRCYDRYKLYPTTNMYNFLKLDTRKGVISIVQWSLEDGKEFEYSLNRESLVSEWNDYGCGTFELYPTTNHYQFLLLNKVNGSLWHVQWGFENTERWIRRIY